MSSAYVQRRDPQPDPWRAQTRSGSGPLDRRWVDDAITGILERGDAEEIVAELTWKLKQRRGSPRPGAQRITVLPMTIHLAAGAAVPAPPPVDAGPLDDMALPDHERPSMLGVVCFIIGHDIRYRVPLGQGERGQCRRCGRVLARERIERTAETRDTAARR